MNIKYVEYTTDMMTFKMLHEKWMYFDVKVNALNIPPDDYDRKIKS